jgi:DNA-binding HxlR family transcriptional regulator
MHQQYGQFCPVAMASEVLAERWTLIILRELLAGSRRFNEIRRGVPRLSPTLLKQRLQTLEKAGIVERQSGTDGGFDYLLTQAGRDLKPVVHSVGEWGQRWARDIEKRDLDPGLLMWAMHRRLNTPVMPSGRTVIAIEFLDARISHRHFWLVHNDGDVQVCLKDPGYDTSVYVSTHLRVLAEVWRGIRSIGDELRTGTIHLSGSPALCRDFPRWLLLSHFAPIRRMRGVT